MLGLGNSICANHYPGGWNPSNLGNKLKVWLQFNTGISTTVIDDQDQVTVWADQSGNGNNVAPTVTNNKGEMPRHMADGTVRFNATGDSLIFTSALSLGEFAIYWKSRWGNTVAGTGADVPFEGTSQDFIKLASPTEIRIKINNQTREDATINEITDDGTTPVILGIERASNGDLAAYKDNVAGEWSTSSGKDGNTPLSGNNFDITQLGDGVDQTDWFEVVICNDALSAAERNELYNYLVNVE